MVQGVSAFDEDDCTVTYRSRLHLDTYGPPADAEFGGSNAQWDTLVFECAPGYASAHDRVVVYVKDRALNPHQPWHMNVAFEDEIWIFDADADGTANLIIDFYRTPTMAGPGSELIADFYDDQDGDAQVAYRLQQGWPLITESAFWTVQLRALDGWWVREGKLNFNLDIAVDGPVMAMASFDRFLESLETDGDVDFHIKIRDLDNSGRGDYDFRWSETSLPETWGLRRVNLAVDESPADAPPLSAQFLPGQVFWPYLGTVYGPLRYADGTLILVPYKDLEERRYGFIQGYNQSGGGMMPPIQIGWQKAKIVFVAEFVPSRGGEHNWFIYAIPPYRPGLVAATAPGAVPYRADFENPFGFYDMAGDGDGIPELLVRVEGYAEDDVYSPISGRPFSSVRFSWDQDNDGAWEYTMNLHGMLDLATETIMVDTIPIVSVPYAALPERVLSKTWDHITFISHMKGGFVGMEGIYIWGMPYTLRDEYFSGMLDEPPLDTFQQIPAGYRGEVALKPGLRARLYFSPIDCALHLVDAAFGIWNLNDHVQVLYENLDEDAYIDHWRYVRDGQVEQALYVAADYLVYRASDKIAIKRLHNLTLERPPEIVPPHNSATWSALAASLEGYPCALDMSTVEVSDADTYDFAAMFAQYGDPDWMVEGAGLRDLQYDPQSIRFVLDLLPDFHAHGTGGPQLEGAPGSGDLQRASVGVIYNRGAGFEVVSLRSPRPVVESVTVAPDPLVESVPAVVEALVKADGDAIQTLSVPITLYVQSEVGDPVALDTMSLTLRADESKWVHFSWLPESAGPWRIWLTTDRSLDASTSKAGLQREGQIYRLAEMDVEVQEDQRPTLAWSFQLAGIETVQIGGRRFEGGTGGGIVIFFGALVLIGSIIALFLVRHFAASGGMHRVAVASVSGSKPTESDALIAPVEDASPERLPDGLYSRDRNRVLAGSWEKTVPIVPHKRFRPLVWLTAIKPVHIFILALLIRVVYTLVAPQVDPFLQRDPLLGDAGSYDRIIRSLLAGSGYRQLDLVGPHFPKPDVFWPPLYPLMMAGVYRLLGSISGLGYNLLMGRLFHALLGASVPVGVYFIGRALFDKRSIAPVAVASLAGLGSAFYPYLIYFGAWLIADGPYMVLLTLTLLTAVALQKSFARGLDKISDLKLGEVSDRYPAGYRVILAAILGLLLGLDILMKPATLMLLPPLLFWFLLALDKCRWLTRLALGFLTLVVMLSVIAPWTLRNYKVTGDWILVSANGGYTFYGANNPDAFGGHREGFPIRDPQKPAAAEEREFYRRALAWIRQNPQDFLALVPKKIMRLFSPLAVASLEAPYPLPFAGWVYLLYGLFLTCAFWGIARSLNNWRAFSVLYIPILGVLLSTVLFYGDTRYSLPMVPSLILFAAKAIVDAMGSLRADSSRPQRWA
jgi:4-amino-4-deoxy-L-arabinose transferase-like glycosyltransferase